MNSVALENRPLPAAVAAPLARGWSEAEAFAYCSTLTRSHYENFPVGSFLIPRALQPAVHSLYAFMRTADDFSDEDRRAGDERERMAWLNSWEAMLDDCQKGHARHPIFVALAATLARHQLPAQWLHDLLHAFKMDVTVRRYETWANLQEYCRYSANPVGRLILTLFGYRQDELYVLSDAICTALQLANHWQDVAIDLKKDRIYLPQDEMKRFGVSEEWLKGQSSPADRDGVSWERFEKLMQYQIGRARDLFEQGRPLPERVSGRLRWELRWTRRGGMRILDKIERVHCDVFKRRPVVTVLDWILIGQRTLLHG